jgi:hypothetical protein
MFVGCECRVMSGKGLCDELITRPEASYRLWCVVVCDLETSRMRPWPALFRSATEKKYTHTHTHTHTVCPKSKCTDFFYVRTVNVYRRVGSPYLFQLDWMNQSCTTAVSVWSCFITTLRWRCKKIWNKDTLSNFVWNLTNLLQRHLLLWPKLVEMLLYRELWFVSDIKLSKRAEKTLKTTHVLEDQSCQQMIKMWKWCELWWRKTADWVSGWLQNKRAWIKMQFIEF